MGDSFRSKDYSIFMPSADGPCRFGMYNKFQRIILDSYPEFKEVRLVSLSTEFGYMVGGLIEKTRARDFRKMGYTATIVGDLLERLLWRVRPYEKEPGLANKYIEKALQDMVESFKRHAHAMEFEPIYDKFRSIFDEAKEIIDPAIPPKPLIGVVGEIYLRCHVESNQRIIETLEKYGAEVVNASVGEWINYTSYEKLMKVRDDLKFYTGRFDFANIRKQFNEYISFGGDSLYQKFRQNSLYKLACGLLPIHGDHDIADLENQLKKSNLLGFQIPGEACLSIAGALTYRENGFNGVVNVYPFTCMPSTVTSSILKPWFHERKFPYMDAPYDDSYQPGREAAIRTFMYQAHQNFERNRDKRVH